MENVASRRAPSDACEYAVASRAMAGQRRSGDAALVCAGGDGLLVAVVDGLGHGDEAAVAAGVAIRTLREQAGQPIESLFQRCHETLQATRGAAIALAMLDASRATVTWSGVGNVEGILVRSSQHGERDKLYLTNRGGVVGYRLPLVHASVFQIAAGDQLIFATDGIDECFTSGDIPHGPPDRVARAILDRHGKATDDALVLVLRWRGPGGGAAIRRREQ